MHHVRSSTTLRRAFISGCPVSFTDSADISREGSSGMGTIHTRRALSDPDHLLHKYPRWVHLQLLHVDSRTNHLFRHYSLQIHSSHVKLLTLLLDDLAR